MWPGILLSIFIIIESVNYFSAFKLQIFALKSSPIRLIYLLMFDFHDTMFNISFQASRSNQYNQLSIFTKQNTFSLII